MDNAQRMFVPNLSFEESSAFEATLPGVYRESLNSYATVRGAYVRRYHADITEALYKIYVVLVNVMSVSLAVYNGY